MSSGTQDLLVLDRDLLRRLEREGIATYSVSSVDILPFQNVRLKHVVGGETPVMLARNSAGEIHRIAGSIDGDELTRFANIHLLGDNKGGDNKGVRSQGKHLGTEHFTRG